MPPKKAKGKGKQVDEKKVEEKKVEKQGAAPVAAPIIAPEQELPGVEPEPLPVRLQEPEEIVVFGPEAAKLEHGGDEFFEILDHRQEAGDEWDGGEGGGGWDHGHDGWDGEGTEVEDATHGDSGHNGAWDHGQSQEQQDWEQPTHHPPPAPSPTPPDAALPAPPAPAPSIHHGTAQPHDQSPGQHWGTSQGRHPPPVLVSASEVAQRAVAAKASHNSHLPNQRPGYYWGGPSDQNSRQPMAPRPPNKVTHGTPYSAWGQPKNVDPWGEPKQKAAPPPKPPGVKQAWEYWGREAQSAARVQSVASAWDKYNDNDDDFTDDESEETYTAEEAHTQSGWYQPQKQPKSSHGVYTHGPPKPTQHRQGWTQEKHSQSYQYQQQPHHKSKKEQAHPRQQEKAKKKNKKEQQSGDGGGWDANEPSWGGGGIDYGRNDDGGGGHPSNGNGKAWPSSNGHDKGWGHSDDGHDQGWGQSNSGHDQGWGQSNSGHDKGWGQSNSGHDKGWGQPKNDHDKAWGDGARVKGDPDDGWGSANDGGGLVNDSGWGDVKEDYGWGDNGRASNFKTQPRSTWGGSQTETTYSMPSKTMTHAYNGTHAPPSNAPQTNKMNDYTNIKFIESHGMAFSKVQAAIFGGERKVKDRIHWMFSPDKNERVSEMMRWITAMEYNLGSYGLHKFLQSRERGALFVNATFRMEGHLSEPAFDWLTFDQLRQTRDPILQNSVIHYDPAMIVYVFVFLPSESGNSVAMWRRKILIPNNTRLRFQHEIGIAKGGLRKDKDYVVHVDELPSKGKTKDATLKRTKSLASPTNGKKKRKWWQVLRFAE